MPPPFNFSLDLTSESESPGPALQMTLRSKTKGNSIKPEDPRRVLFSYGESICITAEDLDKCSNEELFLNDSIIDFYLRHLISNEFYGTQSYAFTAFLYTKIINALKVKSWSGCFDEVKRWSIEVGNVFSQSILLFPINQELHWSLIACCFDHQNQGVVFSFDSLNETSPHQSEVIAGVIRMYLCHEYDNKIIHKNTLQKRIRQSPQANRPNTEEEEDAIFEEVFSQVKSSPIVAELSSFKFTEQNFPLVKVKVPQQQDGVNCGLHLLNNARMLLGLLDAEGISDIFTFSNFVKEQYSSVNFTTRDANSLRENLKNQILETEKYESLRRPQ